MNFKSFLHWYVDWSIPLSTIFYQFNYIEHDWEEISATNSITFHETATFSPSLFYLFIFLIYSFSFFIHRRKSEHHLRTMHRLSRISTLPSISSCTTRTKLHHFNKIMKFYVCFFPYLSRIQTNVWKIINRS